MFFMPGGKPMWKQWMLQEATAILMTLIALALGLLLGWKWLRRKASKSKLVVKVRNITQVDKVHPLDLDPNFVARFEDGSVEVQGGCNHSPFRAQNIAG